MAAAQREEAEARQKALESTKMQGEVEEAYEMLGSLDNALKAFTGRLGLEEEVSKLMYMPVCICIYMYVS